MAFTTIKRHARNHIEFGHVGIKVQLVCLDCVHAHNELGGDVEDGEEYDREVVDHEHAERPVTLEEHVPTAELE